MGKKKKTVKFGDGFVNSDANFNCTKLSMVIEFEPSEKLKRAMKKKKVLDYYFPTGDLGRVDLTKGLIAKNGKTVVKFNGKTIKGK